MTVKDLSKHFAGSVALDRLSFDVHAGEVIGLIGANGAGKTTTLKCLLGLLKPSHGAAQVMGHDCTHDARRVKSSVGYTADEPRFYDFLSGRETIQFVIHARSLNADASWKTAEELVAQLELGPQLDMATGSYSLGMKKKLAVVCALLHRPRVLLLDEPTNGLDPVAARQVRELIRREAVAGAAVLVSTHLLDMAEQLCDRLLLLQRGRAIALAAPAQLRKLAALPNGASLEDVIVRLMDRS